MNYAMQKTLPTKYYLTKANTISIVECLCICVLTNLFQATTIWPNKVWPLLIYSLKQPASNYSMNCCLCLYTELGTALAANSNELICNTYAKSLDLVFALAIERDSLWLIDLPLAPFCIGCDSTERQERSIECAQELGASIVYVLYEFHVVVVAVVKVRTTNCHSQIVASTNTFLVANESIDVRSPDAC